MKNFHLAKFFAVGVGLSTITANVEASVNSAQSQATFGVLPQEVPIQICETDVISIGNVHQMIAERNTRDAFLVSSASDKMNHL